MLGRTWAHTRRRQTHEPASHLWRGASRCVQRGDVGSDSCPGAYKTGPRVVISQFLAPGLEAHGDADADTGPEMSERLYHQLVGFHVLSETMSVTLFEGPSRDATMLTRCFNWRPDVAAKTQVFLGRQPQCQVRISKSASRAWQSFLPPTTMADGGDAEPVWSLVTFSFSGWTGPPPEKWNSFFSYRKDSPEEREIAPRQRSTILIAKRGPEIQSSREETWHV